MDSITWMIEIAVTALLIVALWRAARLERALAVLRQDRAALATAVLAFQDSARLAEEGARKLRSASDDADAKLTARMRLGDNIQTDLSYLVDRGDALAAQLEGLVRAARPAVAALSASREPAPAAPKPAPSPVPTPVPDQVAEQPEERPARQRFAATVEREREILRALGLSK